MPRLTPVKWRDLVKRLRALGFDGPFSGGKHLYKGQKKHRGGISPPRFSFPLPC